MLKKTTIALTSAGFISLAAAHHISACDFELGNCTGYFYNDISAAFVDCYDSNGVLSSRKEAFYTSPLQKECNTTDGASFMQSLNGTSVAVPANITDMTNLTVCDYFSFGEGYQFSQAESGIGLVILGDRYNSARGLYYQNATEAVVNVTDVNATVPMPTPQLNWNWSELSGLIAQLQNVQCNVVNSTTNITAPVDFGTFNLYAALNLPWTQWSQQAVSNINISSWGKAEWKMWIENYVIYWNAVQTYIAQGEAILAGAANGVSNASGLLGSYEEQVRAGIEQARAILSQGALLLSENVQIDGVANFTQFWKPEFDLDTVTLAEIKADLNIVSNIVVSVEGWFTAFFVNGGIDSILGQNTNYVIVGENGESVNISTGTAENTVTLGVSSQVEAIVAWITSNFNSELSSVLSQYNITFSAGVSVSAEVNGTVDVNSTLNETEVVNSTDNGTVIVIVIDDNSTDNGTVVENNGTIVDNSTILDNSTVIDNSTILDNSTVVDNSTVDNSTVENNGTEIDNGTGSGNSGNIDLFVNYALPEGCLFTDENNDTCRCSSGNARGVTFTIVQVKEYFNATALEVCTDFSSVLASCETNTVINDLPTCLRLSLYNKFQLAQETIMYGWLSYDVVARNTLFGRCQVENASFNSSAEQFSSGFAFDFPNIN